MSPLMTLFGRTGYFAGTLAFLTLLIASPTSAQPASDPDNPPWIVRSPGDPDVFKLGDEIIVEITFTDLVRVTGNPRVSIDIGGTSRYAAFSTADGTAFRNTVRFRYVVQADDEDTDGLDIVANSLELNGGTIEGTDESDATLGHPGQPATDTRRPVDGVVPTVTFSGSGKPFEDPAGLVPVVVLFSEPVTGVTLSDFTVTNGTADDLEEETHVEPAGSAWSFVIDPYGEGPVTVDLPADKAQDDAGNGNAAATLFRVLVGDPATVTITPSTSNTSEGQPVVFELQRSKDNGERDVEVEVNQAGDYLTGDISFGGALTTNPDTVSVTIAAGETARTLSLSTEDDYLVEADGSVTITVLADPTEVGYLRGTPYAATATVRSEDPPLYLTVNSRWVNGPEDADHGNVREGARIRFTVVRSHDVGEHTVDVEIKEAGDFLAGSHPDGLTLPADGRVPLTFAAGELSAEIVVDTEDDATREDDGSVTLTVVPRLGDPLNPVPRGPKVVTVWDDDDPPTVTVAADDAVRTEGDLIGFTLTRTTGPTVYDGAMNVRTETTQDGTVLQNTGTVQFTGTFRDGAATLDIARKAYDDAVAEPDGGLTLQVLPPESADEIQYQTGTPSSATTTVKDNDPPLVSVSAVTDQVTEGTDAVFRFNRIGSTAESLTFRANIFGHRKTMSDATTALANRIEAAGDVAVTFDAGASDTTLALTTEADAVNEGDGLISVSIVGLASNSIGGSGSAEVLIQDDDVPEVTLKWISPEMTLEDNVWVGEMVEGEAILYEVVCSGGTLAPDQTSFSGDTRPRIVTRKEEELNHPLHNYDLDFTFRAPCHDQPYDLGGPVYFGNPNRRFTGPGNGEIRVEILPQVKVVNYLRCYTDEVRGTPDGLEYCPKYTVGAVKSARIAVINRNPTITVEALADTVDEGQPARFKLTRIWAADLISTTGVYSTTVAISTTEVGDYVSTFPDRTRTFNPGDIELFVEISTTQDFVPGPDGSVTLELEAESAELQSQNIGGSYEFYDQLDGITPAGKSSKTATVVVRNTDVFPALSIAAAAAEEGMDVAFVATLSDAHDQTVTVDWALKDGTAVAGSDYTDDSGTLTFDAGVTDQTVSVVTLEDQVPESDETFALTLANPVQVTLPGGVATTEITGTITNDDHLPVVTITPQATPVDEGQSPWFVLTREGFTDDGLDVALSLTLDGTAKPGRTVRIPAGEQSHAFRVRHVDEDKPTKTEYVYVATIEESAAKYIIGTPGSATVKVLNDDMKRAITTIGAFTPTEFAAVGDTLTARYYNYNEGNVATGSPVMLHSSLFGSIVASASPVSHVSTDSEFIVEREYVVTEADTAAKIITETYYLDDGKTQSAPFTINAYHEDIQFRYTIRPRSTDFPDEDDENQNQLGVSVLRVDFSTQSHTVRYYTADDEAEAGADYTAVEGTLTFPQGSTRRDVPLQTVSIPLINDVLDEPYEFFKFIVVDNGDDTQVLAQAKVGIDDDDPPVVPDYSNNHQLSPPMTNEAWGSEYGVLRVNVELHRLLDDGASEGFRSGKTVEFTYQTVDGTAKGGEDFTHVTGRAVLSPAPSTATGHWGFDIPVFDDSIYEGDTPETFSIELSDGVNIDIPEGRKTYTIEIADNDEASDAFSLAVSPSSVAENGGDTGITVTATVNKGAFTEDTEINISVEDSTATAGSDFAAVTGFILTIPANELSGTAAFTLTPTDDGVIEDPEVFRITGAATGLTMSPEEGVTVQIDDDDERGVTIDPVSLTIDEEQTGTYTAALTSVPTGTVNVTPSLPSGGPVTVSPASLTFSAMDWDTPKTVTVSATADVDAEHESARIANAVSGADYGTHSVTADTVAVSVTDDENPSTAIVLEASPDTVAEGGGGQTVTVTAALDEAPLKADVTIRVNIGADAATGADFAAVAPFEVTISAGVDSNSATFTLSPVDDDVDEDDETFDITGQVVADGAPVADALPVMAGTVVIEDDDTRGVTVNPTTLTVPEDGGQGSYTVVLTSAPSEDATLRVVVPANSDLTVSPARLDFGRDSWSTAQTVTVTASVDADAVTDVVALGHAATGGDYEGIAVDDVTVTISEPTSATMTVADVRGTEGSGTLTFEVALEKAIQRVATVQYRTAGKATDNQVTAEAGEDFIGVSDTLTFAVGETQKTVQVDLVDNTLNEADEYFELVLENPVNAALPQPTPQTRTVQGIIEDDDPLPVLSVVGTTEDGWSYGDEATDDLSYTVRLSAASGLEVTVEYATADPSSGDGGSVLNSATAGEDYESLSGTLTFAPGETGKSLTVTVNDDEVSEEDETFALRLSNPRNAVLSNQGWGGIRDDDTRGLKLVPGTLTIGEGKAKTYTLALSSQPTAAVTVTLTSGAGVRASPLTRSFSETDWSTAKTVTVTSLHDDDAVDNSAGVGHSFAGGDYTGHQVDPLVVTVTDDDRRGIVLSKSLLTLTEGSNTSYTVKLDTRPTGTVTVTISGTIGTNLSLSPTSLTFMPSGWNTEQTVTVTDGGDSDAANDAATLRHTASGGDYSPPAGAGSVSRSPTRDLPVTKALPVAVTDNDTRGLVLSETSLLVTEGDSATYSVKLATLPLEDVTVTIAGTEGTDLTLDPAGLTFTPRNWSVARTVTVRAGDDDDAARDRATLTHAVSGGDYASVTAPNVLVTVDDDETASTKVTLSVSPASVAEDAEATTVTVTGTLDEAPRTSDAEVTVSVGATGDGATEGTDYVSVADLTLTISAGQTLGTKAFTLTPTDDDVDEEDEALTVSGTTTATGLSVTDTTATIIDNDTRGVTVSHASLPVTEGASATYTVVLTSQPTASVTVTPSRESGSSTDVSFRPSSLTFTPSTWATAKTVTVSAGEDPDAEADEATITHAVAGGDYASATVSKVDVTVTDNQTASTKVTLSVSPASVAEDAEATTVTVTGTLDEAPRTSDTEVTVSVGATGDGATEGTDYLSVDNFALTISAGQTLGTKAFSLTPTDDDIDEDDDETLTVSGTTTATGLSVVSTALTIDDNETAAQGTGRGVTVTPTAMLIEEGKSTTYEVVLKTQPTASVTVTPSRESGSSTDVSFSPSSLTFLTSTWATAQTVTVSAGADADGEDDEATITHAVAGGDYASATASNVDVTVDDDETASTKVTLTVSPASVAEDAEPTTVTVTGTLDGAPRTSAASVTVSVGAAGDAATEGTDYVSVADLTLTISAGQTTGTKTFGLTPTDDDVDEEDETLAVSGTTTATGLSVSDTTATIIDNDTRGVTVSHTSLPVTEEASATYTVVLTSQPTASVTVTPSVTDNPDVTIDSSPLTFLTSTWATAQTVTVSAGADTDGEDDEATITHAVAGGDYASATVSKVDVTVDDDETASTKVTLSVSPASVAEDAEATTVTVAGTLDEAPRTSDTEVTVSVGAAGDGATEGTDYATVDNFALTISAGQTLGTKAFGLTPTDDDVDEEDEALTVSGTTTATGLSVTDTTATIIDNDTRGVKVSHMSLPVTEGASATYTVVLTSQPTASVTVTPSRESGSSTDVSFRPSSLTFTPSTWATAKTVTVSAGEDPDAEADEATITHAVAGGDYASATVSKVDVTVTDNQTASTKVTLSVSPTSVDEDEEATTVTVTGTLDGAPRTSDTEVTVSVGATDDGATEGTDYVSVADLTLTISAGQTLGTKAFTLTPTDDDVDEEDEALTVSGTTTATGLSVTDTTATIIDNDTRGVTVSHTSLPVTEGASATYTVVLTSQPTASVTVTPSVTDNPDVTIDSSPLTFTPSTWETAQTVTVSAGADADGEDDEATITHAVAGGDYASAKVSKVDVTVDDDETASTKVTLSVSPASVVEDAEATTVTVTGTLDEAPRTSDTGVTLSVGAAGDGATEGTDYVSVADLTLTISAGQTMGTKAFSLTPTDDDVDEEDEALTVSGTTTATGLSVTDTTATIIDNDTRGVTVSPASLPVTEGASATYTVVLTSQPTASVTVSPSRESGSSTDVSFRPSSLTFTPSTWATAKTVTVSAGEDPDAEADEATIIHAVAGGDYASATVSTVDVTVTDNQTASTKVTLSVSPASVDEDGEATTVTVAGTLDEAPRTSDTEVTVSVGATDDGATEGTDYVSVADLTLTISAGQTMGTKAFSLTPTDDDVDEEDETLTVSGTTSATGLSVTDTTATIIDDDTRGVTVSHTSLPVTEGASATYTVVLTSQPTASVTVTPSVTDNPDVTIDSSPLTFTPSTWETAQTVTVSAGADADGEDDEATITHAVAGGDYASAKVPKVDVTVDDDETASTKVTLSVSPASVVEAGEATTVTVAGTLDGAPRTSDTEVTVSVGAAGDGATEGTDYATVDNFALTISAGQTLGTKAFSLTPTDDDVDEEDEKLTVSGTTTATGLGVTDTTATIIDNDMRGVTVSHTSLPVTEGSSTTYTVVLTSQPTASVTVTPSVTDNPDVTIDSSPLTFTPSTWETAQTVTVSAGADADGEDDEATITHAVAGGDYASAKVSKVDVTVDDDETASTKVTLSVSPASVDEDGEATTVTVAGTLDEAPRTSDTEVTVSVGAAGDGATEGTDYVSVADLTLTISAGQTMGTKAFSLTPTDDDVDEEDEALTVSGTTTATGLSVTDTTATIIDNDTRGVTVSPASLPVTEGASATYTVVLTSQPTASVTVTPSRESGSSTDVSFRPSSLTFLTSTWATATTVTVSAGEDADAEADEAKITHAVAGGDYASAKVSTVDVTVTDNQTASTKVTLSVSPASVAEDEEATTVTVTGTLDEAPRTSDTEVTVSVGAAGDGATEGTDYVSVADLTLTISAGQTLGTKAFTLTPTDDDVDEEDEALTVSGTTTATGLSVTDTTATIIDNDTRGVTVSHTSLPVTEGTSATYTVVLTSQPTASVTVTPSVTDNLDVTIDSSPLTFTPSTWETAQTVTVSAGEDPDGEDDEATITHAVAGGDYASAKVSKVDVTVTDNEKPSTKVTLKVNPASVDEDAEATTVTVTGTLDGAVRTSDVDVTVSVGATGDDATEGTDYASIVSFTLTISAGQTSGTETFSLTPTDDDVDEEDETISASGTTTAAGLGVTGMTVTIVDDDARGVTVSPASLPVTEGASATYTVVLTSQPTASVTVTPSRESGSSTDVTFGPSSLTFTPSTWETAKTVTVSAAPDADAEDDEATIEHEVAGGDYASETASDVAVTVDDGETASTKVTLSVSPASVAENVEATTVTVTGTLDDAPRALDTEVTVSVGADGDAATEGTDYATVDNFILSISAGQTSGTQAFSLTPTDDDVDEEDEALTVSGTTTATGLSVTDTTANIIDDDTRGVTVSHTSLRVIEGATAAYTVVLESQPTATVIVTPSVTDNPDVSVAPSSLTFSTATWQSAKTVTVSADEDADEEGDEASIVHAVRGGDYASETVSNVKVLVMDNESAFSTVTLSVSPASVSEGASPTTVTVRGTLDGSQRTVPTIVTVSVGAAGDGATEGSDYASVANFTLTISAGQTSGTQAFALTPIDDDVDESDETISVSGTTSATGLSVTGTTANITDDDTRGVTVTPASLSVTEGATATYTVALASQPTAGVTVTIGGATDTDVSLSRTSLAFTTAAWNTAQTVTVSAGDDADETDDRVRLAHTASGGDYGSVRSDLIVTVSDDDDGGTNVAGLSASPDSLTVGEGGSARFSVSLASQPDSSVTVLIRGLTGTDLTTDLTRLSFTTVDWNAPKAVTVSAAHDDDETNDRETLKLTASGGSYGSVRRDLSVTVIDDDRDARQVVDVTVSFDQEVYTAVEGGTPARVKVRVMLNRDPERAVTVPLRVTLNGGATTDDYEGVPPSISFGSGEMEKTFQITAIDDEADDDDESLTVGFGDLPDGVFPGRPANALVRLEDNDSPVTTVSFEKSSYEAQEGGAPAPVTVRIALSDDPERELAVPLEVTLNGGATIDDYEGVPASVTFGSGEMQKSFRITAIDDEEDDDGESLTVAFGALPEGVLPGEPASATVQLLDNDAPVVTVAFDHSTYRAEEGGRPARVTVSLSTDPEREVAIPLTATPGDGATEADYGGVPPVVTFNPGETAKTFEVIARDDAIDDDGESSTLGFGALAPSVDADEQSTAVVRLIDNDRRGVTVSVENLEVPEGAAAAYTVVLHSEPTASVVVAVTGSSGTDVLAAPLQLTFAAWDWDAPQEVAVRALEDDDAVADRVTLHHTVSGGDYGEEVAPPVTVTVVEDDVPAVSILDQRGAEHVGALEFTVMLDMPSSEEAVVGYTTDNGSAQSGEDYAASTGTLRFPALTTRLNISVPILDDDVEEDTETFTVRLRDPVRATLGGEPAAATGTIEDNDAAIRALEILLSGVGRMVASEAIEVVGRRFDPRTGWHRSFRLGGQSFGGRGDSRMDASGDRRVGVRHNRSLHGPGIRMPLEALMYRGRGDGVGAVDVRQMTVWDLLSRTDFSVPLSDGGRAGGWTVWGRGAIGGFSGTSTPARRVDADAFSSYIGIDYNVRAKALLGLALTHSLGDMNYVAANPARTIVPVDFGITTVLPYLHLQFHPRFGIWALSGIGRGDIELVDQSRAYNTDMSLLMGAGGAKQHLASRGRFGLALKGDAFYVQAESAAGQGLPNVREEAKRVRVLIEGSRVNIIGSTSRVSQSLEIGGRWDRGRIENGTGLDIGGGIDYDHTGRGISMAARGRYLVIHEQEGYHEWGASLILRISPGASRQGLVVEASPVWGEPGSNGAALWRGATGNFSRSARPPDGSPDQIKIDVGYQLLTPAGNGRITPYGGWATGRDDNRSYHFGGRIIVGRTLSLNVEGRLDDRPSGDDIYRVRILGHVAW